MRSKREVRRASAPDISVENDQGLEKSVGPAVTCCGVLGAGEYSALAVAVNRGYAIAIDDNRALSRAFGEAGLESARIEIIRTPDVMIALIRAGVLTVEEADAIKDEWARQHRFRINAATFGVMI